MPRIPETIPDVIVSTAKAKDVDPAALAQADQCLADIDEVLDDLRGQRLFGALARAGDRLNEAIATQGVRVALDARCFQIWTDGKSILEACTAAPDKVLYCILRLSAQVEKPSALFKSSIVPGSLVSLYGQYLNRRSTPNAKVRPVRYSIWKRVWVKNPGAAIWRQILGSPAIGNWADLVSHKDSLHTLADMLMRSDVQESWANAVDEYGGGYQSLRVAPKIYAHMLRLFLLPRGRATALAVFLACLIPLLRDGGTEANTVHAYIGPIHAGLFPQRRADPPNTREWSETAGASRLRRALGTEIAEHIGDGLDPTNLEALTAPLCRCIGLLSKCPEP